MGLNAFYLQIFIPGLYLFYSLVGNLVPWLMAWALVFGQPEHKS